MSFIPTYNFRSFISGHIVAMKLMKSEGRSGLKVPWPMLLSPRFPETNGCFFAVHLLKYVSNFMLSASHILMLVRLMLKRAVAWLYAVQMRSFSTPHWTHPRRAAEQ